MFHPVQAGDTDHKLSLKVLAVEKDHHIYVATTVPHRTLRDINFFELNPTIISQTSKNMSHTNTSVLPTPPITPSTHEFAISLPGVLLLGSLPAYMQDCIPTDEDAEGVDEYEEIEQYRRMYQKQFQATKIMTLRKMCKERGLRVRDNRAVLVERLVEDSMKIWK